VRAVAAALGRQALHARLLGFRHPATGAEVDFETPVPADLQAAIDALRALTRR
jgi:23S rRNA pseudouridine1911/1915/1917 synthase